MKKLLLLLICLSVKSLLGSEPPSSPRQGRKTERENFLKKLQRHIKRTDRQEERPSSPSQEYEEEEHHPLAIPLPRLPALSPKSFRNLLDAALKKLDQRPSILK